MNHSARRSRSKQSKSSSGIALVTTLLMLVMLSALAMAFVLAVNTENRMQSSDKGATRAYYGAEAGMEKMMADLNGLYSSTGAPTVCQLQTLGNGPVGCSGVGVTPAIPNISYSEYTLNPTPDPTFPTQPKSYATTVAAGPNQGLIADVIPLSLAVTANVTPTQETVRMTRQVEVALIPIFQFGVFSSSDLDFFAGPPLDIGGRIQTNGDLYLAAGGGGDTTFLGKLRTSKEVVRDSLSNGLALSTSGHSGIVEIPTSTGGCSGSKPACRPLTYTGPDESSWVGGTWPNPRPFPNTPSTGTPNTGSGSWSWTQCISGNGTGVGCSNPPGYSGFIMAEEDGILPLNLPFTKGGTSNIEILRRPQPAESAFTTESRLFSKAQIRVLLDDDPVRLSAGGAADPDNVRLANVPNIDGTPGHDYTNGVLVSPMGQLGTATCGTGAQPCATYFAEGLRIVGTNLPSNANFNPVDSKWVSQPNTDDGKAGSPRAPLNGGTGINPVGAPVMTIPASFNLPASDAASQRWNLLDGWLRVEYRKADGTYAAVTHEWLKLGFARGFDPPNAANPNPVHPDAILILQQLKYRDALVTGAGPIPRTPRPVLPPPPTPIPPTLGLLPGASGIPWVGSTAIPLQNGGLCTVTAPCTATPNTGINFYPINMYDTREGETRETTGNYGCTVNGVMNLAEIDVHNLQRWLSGAIGANGGNVESQSQNGYILYFSDHRGMIPEPLAPAAVGNAILGAYGFEDLINPASTTGRPNALADAGEDTEAPGDSGSGGLEVYGSNNLGLGFRMGPGAGVAINMSDLAPASIRGSAPTHPDLVFTRLTTCDIGRGNWVSGARHGVRLVDGSAGDLPLRANPDPSNVGGFTLASDNPAYVLGDYNASAAGYDSTVNYPHASAAAIADTVTLLSNNWSDLNSFASPGNVNATANTKGRLALNTYYRLAIASGKNVDFPHPNYTGGGAPIGTNGGATNPTDPADTSGTVGGPPSDFGTDGGVHNFLRYLETWGGQNAYYAGSMVSLYYAEYTTGVFKCCGTVYSPPSRHYHFDLDFTNLSEMPPGTPRFQEVINVGYKQDLSYR